MSASKRLILFQEAQNLSQSSGTKENESRFKRSNLPNKDWLVNIIYILDDHAQIFQRFSDQVNALGITQDDLNIQKNLDASYGRKSSMKFLKRTHDQVNNRNNLFKNRNQTTFNVNLKEENKRRSNLNKKINNYQFKLEQYQQNLKKEIWSQHQKSTVIQEQQKHLQVQINQIKIKCLSFLKHQSFSVKHGKWPYHVWLIYTKTILILISINSVLQKQQGNLN